MNPMEVKIYNREGKETGTVALPERVFGLKWNATLVHQVVVAQQANARRGTAHTKNRGEVSGGGKKPWKQKGTGRARHGSTRSPIWVGGGVTHGPRKEKIYERKINKKMAKRALEIALSAKARDGELVILEDVDFSEMKTKRAGELFSALARHSGLGPIRRANGVLVALSQEDWAARRAMQNLSYVRLDEARNLYADEVLRYKYLVFPKRALDVFAK